MRLFTTLGIVAAVGMTLVACGSDDDGGGGGGSGGSTGGSGGSTGGSGGSTGGSGGSTGGTAGAATGGTAGAATGGTAGAATGGTAGATGNDCEPCVTANCQAEAGECAADTNCAPILVCSLACNDAACVQGCFDATPAGQQKFEETVVACAEAECATECEGAFPQ